jgi:multidrug efflux pump subunit AcrB
MNASRIFIERPVMTALITAAILLFGIVGYRALPVAALPSVDYPTIQVGAGLPGADPETMATSLATPLERQFSTIAGIETMSSSSSQGGTSITIQFSLDRNIDAAAQDVQAAISAATGSLPPDMPRPPSYQKVNPAEQPILYLALTSKTLPLYVVEPRLLGCAWPGYRRRATRRSTGQREYAHRQTVWGEASLHLAIQRTTDQRVRV